MNDNVTFLREYEQRYRNMAANLNPCAVSLEENVAKLLAIADRFKACADEIVRLRLVTEEFGIYVPAG